jgi:hypothetical protein
MYQVWFNSATEVQTLEDDATFIYGGYYSYPLDDDQILMIVMNSNYFMGIIQGTIIDQTEYQQEVAVAQLAWLREELEKDEYLRYVLVYHMVPGINWEYCNNWRVDYREEFYSIVSEFSEKIDYSFSGHAHLASVRALVLDDG